MSKNKSLMILLTVLLIGFFTLFFVLLTGRKEQIKMPFEREDILMISLKGISENTINKEKIMKIEEEIDEIWNFIKSLEKTKKYSSEEQVGGAVYSMEITLLDQSVHKIIFYQNRAVGNALFYLLDIEGEKITAISTINLGDLTYDKNSSGKE